jgi:hypothetical protein
MRQTSYDYYKSVDIANRVTVYKVDGEKAKVIFAENGGLPYDTKLFCAKNKITIDAFTPIGWIFKLMTDYSDIDGIVDNYKSLSHMFMMYSGHNYWDVKATPNGNIVKRNSINIAVDLAMHQMLDAGIASIVDMDDSDIVKTTPTMFIRLPPAKKPSEKIESTWGCSNCTQRSNGD